MTRLEGTSLFLARRVLGAAGTMLALATVVFFLLKLTPGDEARTAAGETATTEQVALVRDRLGLDEPVALQYVRYLGRLVTGDLGTSSSTHGSVGAAIVDVLPGTTELVIVSVALSVLMAVPLAALSALRATGAGDSLRRVLVIVAAGLPTFWLGLMLQDLLSRRIVVLPASGELSLGYDVPRVTGAAVLDSLLAGQPLAAWDAVQHLFLPALVLAVPQAGVMYRVTRSEILRVLTRQHVLVARAAGVPRGRLIRKHVLPQAVTPLIILIGVDFGTLFGAAILVESVFGRQGIGSLLTNAMTQKDTYSVEGGVLVVGLIVVLSSLVVDVVQALRDPRVLAAEMGR